MATRARPTAVTSVLRIATRESEPALRRARAVQAMIAARGGEAELVPFRTAGDKHFDEALTAAAVRTAFTRELEHALVKNKVDCAVHAMPDLAPVPAAGTVVVAVLPRDDPRDVLVLNTRIEAESMDELPRGTRIGTSSVRCRALLQALYPDIEVVHLRGDLRTRLHKVDDGQVHGTIVSAAVLRQLDITQRVAAHLAPPHWLPSPGQGAVAIQARADDAAAHAILVPLNDPRAERDTVAERAVLGSLEGGPQSPIGALVLDQDGASTLHAVIVDLQGRQLLRAERPLDVTDPALSGVRVANELRALGASRILDDVRGMERVVAPQPDS